jgi:hypothetical protein
MDGGLEDAMTTEGRSGLKKLMRMKADVKEIEDVIFDYKNDKVIVRFAMTLPKG